MNLLTRLRRRFADPALRAENAVLSAQVHALTVRVDNAWSLAQRVDGLNIALEKAHAEASRWRQQALYGEPAARERSEVLDSWGMAQLNIPSTRRATAAQARVSLDDPAQQQGQQAAALANLSSDGLLSIMTAAQAVYPDCPRPFESGRGGDFGGGDFGGGGASGSWPEPSPSPAPEPPPTPEPSPSPPPSSEN